MYCFFFFNDTATTEIYTLSLHDALPIWRRAAHEKPEDSGCCSQRYSAVLWPRPPSASSSCGDRKSTRLNSSHANISYAVFCLKKKASTRTASSRSTECSHASLTTTSPKI